MRPFKPSRITVRSRSSYRRWRRQPLRAVLGQEQSSEQHAPFSAVRRRATSQGRTGCSTEVPIQALFDAPICMIECYRWAGSCEIGLATGADLPGAGLNIWQRVLPTLLPHQGDVAARIGWLASRDRERSRTTPSITSDDRLCKPKDRPKPSVMVLAPSGVRWITALLLIGSSLITALSAALHVDDIVLGYGARLCRRAA